MREEHPGGNGLVWVVRIAEGKSQIVADITIQIQLSLFHQPHGANGGKGLRDRSGAVAAVQLQGKVVCRIGCIDIAVSAGTLIDQFPVPIGHDSIAGNSGRIHNGVEIFCGGIFRYLGEVAEGPVKLGSGDGLVPIDPIQNTVGSGPGDGVIRPFGGTGFDRGALGERQIMLFCIFVQHSGQLIAGDGLIRRHSMAAIAHHIAFGADPVECVIRFGEIGVQLCL